MSLEAAFELLSTTNVRDRDAARDISRRVAAMVGEVHLAFSKLTSFADQL